MIPFSEQIKMIRGGELDAELSEKLAEIRFAPTFEKS